MRYSFSEFSPYSKPDYPQTTRPFDVKNTVETSERKGIPNYTTVIPAETEVGVTEEPLGCPSRTTTPRTTTPNTNMERNIPPSTPTAPEQPRTMPGTSPERPRTIMPGTTPVAPTQPRTTMPGTNMPGTAPTQPSTTMPGTTMPGTTMPGTQPRTTMPGTTPSSPGTSMPLQPPFTVPPTRTQEYYNNQDNYNMNFESMDDYINEYWDYDDGNDEDDNMIMPGMFMNPSLPMGIPLMPLYGYDNSEDADKDWDYMRQMYPVIAKKLLKEIEEECDKLEYDGSCMFDEYPDRVYLSRIADKIYDRVKYLEDDDTLVSQRSIEDSKTEDSSVEANQFYRDGRRDGRDRRRRPARLRDLVEVLLLNEILNRRRRFRSRKRWF